MKVVWTSYPICRWMKSYVGSSPLFGHCSSILILEKRLKSFRAEHKEGLV